MILIKQTNLNSQTLKLTNSQILKMSSMCSICCDENATSLSKMCSNKKCSGNICHTCVSEIITFKGTKYDDQVLSYEFPGLKSEEMMPNVYEEVSTEFNFKIKAFKMYKSEIKNFPHPRSLQSIESLAVQRGVESNKKKAEAFRLIRLIN